MASLQSKLPLLVVSLFGLFLGACDDGETVTVYTDATVVESACEPTCDSNACAVCDESGEAAVCVSACGAGTSCQAGACVAPEPPATCEPGCAACQMCDTTGEAPVCVDTCADGTQCVDGACTADPPPTCAPACGDCQVCDVAGEAPMCVDLCAVGSECVEGACVALVPPTCDPACGPCDVCDLSGEAPVCVSTCGAAEYCDGAACRRDGIHARTDQLAGPFDNGPAVTTACLECHREETEHFMRTSHWRWAGPTPGLEGHEDATDIGKRNLINNFCIATASNEPRCTQCHAGYDWRDDTFDLDDSSKVDCLVCHAQPGLYAKDKTTAGNPSPDLDLVVAARSVGPTTKANCGSCHFKAGGGDNVKKGDLGSALLNATPDSDVHMGGGLECANCHAGEEHVINGRSAHGAVANGMVECSECHGGEPHETVALNNHSLDIACQTCHIPAFSRQQPTMMFWDWGTAGNRTLGDNGVVGAQLEDGTPVRAYDAMKGDFIWEKHVKPEFAWYDGRVQRMTTTDTYPPGAGSPESPIILGTPLATLESPNALIWPFKVMRGRQAVDPVRRLIIVPKLFGPGGFWAGIPAADAYTPEAVQTLWANALTAGARAADQIGADEAYGVGDWVWANTELWLGINHEVAPAAVALDCMDCHNNPTFDFEALGYSCDPMVGGPECGSRH
jgi:octaheme c-type cytochrome (tetrathionate reductase family)